MNTAEAYQHEHSSYFTTRLVNLHSPLTYTSGLLAPVLGAAVFALVLLLVFSYARVSVQNKHPLMYRWFAPLEKNIYLVEDSWVLLTVMLFSVPVMLFSYTGLGWNNQQLLSLYAVSSFLIISAALLILPAMVVFNSGVFITTLLKGSATKPGLLYNIASDCLGVVAFSVRYMVQGVRLVLISFLYMTLYEYAYSASTAETAVFVNHTTGFYWYWSDRLVMLARLIAETADLFFIAVVQLSILVFVSTWLLAFLMSTQPASVFEHNFAKN